MPMPKTPTERNRKGPDKLLEDFVCSRIQLTITFCHVFIILETKKNLFGYQKKLGYNI